MGLNVRGMHLHLWRVLQVSAEITYTFIQRHPLVSAALLVFTILYIFLSYIYNFLLYISPFLVYTAIFVAMFWSSEQNLLIYVNKEEKKIVEPTYPNISMKKRRELFYKYPSQNATSRRRNFTRRKLDVYGDIEEKAKDLSEVFRNEFTNKDTWLREDKYIMKEEEGSLDYELSAKENEAPNKQTLYSEPYMSDLVISGAEYGGLEKEIQKKKEEIEAQQDRSKAVELKEDDQKKLMDLGLSEVERNKRLESLKARRRERKLLKLHIENGLTDPTIPREIAPLLIAKGNTYNSPTEFEQIDGIEMPGSAPSVLRSPFDLPYDPNEEKPILKGDSFDQEFFTSLQKELHFCRHESFNYFSLEPRPDLAYPRARRISDKRNEDWFEKLIFKEGNENGSKALPPLSETEETTHEEDGKGKTETAGDKDGELLNDHVTNSISVNASGPDLRTEITNVKSSQLLEKPGGLTIPEPHERVPDFPRSSINATNINDSLYESLPSPVTKNEVNMLFTDGCTSHTPSHSIASDLQVEVSEVGSPTLTVDDSHQSNTTTDQESVVYDGDIDKDIMSDNEEMWGASFNSRIFGANEQDISDLHNWQDIVSPLSPRIIDEENAADVSSMSSRSDMPDDTPTYAVSGDRNIFGIVKQCVGETDAHQPSHSSDVLARWKRLMRLMDKNVNHLPHKTHSEKPEVMSIMSEDLITKAQVINDVNNSATIEQDSTHNSESNENNTAVVQLETTDEVTINSGSSLAYNQETHLGDRQFNVEVMAQATLNGEDQVDTMPQNNHPSMDDPTVESHNSEFRHSQERTYHPENSSEESNTFSQMNDAEVYDKEDGDKLKSDGNNEQKIALVSRQDAAAESPKQVEMMDDGKPRDLYDDKVTLDSVMLESSSDVHRESEDESQTSVRQEAPKEAFFNDKVMDTSSDIHLEEKEHNDLNKNEVMLFPNDTTEEGNYLQSELKQVVEDHMEKEKLDRVDNIYEDFPLPMVTEVTTAEEEFNNEIA